jgi:UDP-N-acetylglucosamine 2-epimerase (non-hydrolysing)
LNSHIRFLKPFGFFDYIKLQMAALCILSDSGTITEEASLLNLPAVTIRNTHERPEGMDVGTLIMTGLNEHRVLDAVRVVIADHNPPLRTLKVPEDYDGGLVSKKILRIVLSYTDYVNRTIWHKL